MIQYQCVFGNVCTVCVHVRASASYLVLAVSVDELEVLESLDSVDVLSALLSHAL